MKQISIPFFIKIELVDIKILIQPYPVFLVLSTIVLLYDAKNDHLYIQSMILRELPTPEAFNRKQKLVFIYVNMKCLFHFPFRTVFSRAFQYPSITTKFCILAFSFCKMTHKKTNVDKLL